MRVREAERLREDIVTGELAPGMLLAQNAEVDADVGVFIVAVYDAP